MTMHPPSPRLLHHTRPFPSSLHCKLSPNGRLVAVITSSSILVRSTGTLRIINVVKVPSQLSGPIAAFTWSPSSSKILIAIADQIHVFSACDSSFHATVHNPATPAGGKLSLIRFGASDAEILACGPFGLKFTVFNLATSRAVEISNPKFHLPVSVVQGFSLHPTTGHLVMLTRVGGKDMVSIHDPSSRKVSRSWQPDSLDAQGIQWTPDGQWIILWESPVQGRRMLVYTAHGQHFRTLETSNLIPDSTTAQEVDMELGIKLCQCSPNAELCVIGDHSRTATVLQTGIWRSTLRLVHPTIITPCETFQVWQEQVTNGVDGSRIHTFHKATQALLPPAPPESSSNSMKQSVEVRPGCSSASFDASSTLLATRLDDSPCTLWIWDLISAELRAVLIFHSPISWNWHPTSRESLLICSQDDGRQGMSYIWDPLLHGPKSLNAEQYLPTPETLSRVQASWLGHESESPELLFGNAENYVLLSLADVDHEASPWEAADDGTEDISSMESMIMAEDISKLDDTFRFRYT